MNNKQIKEELILDMQEIQATFDMGYYEYAMKLDLYSIEEALLEIDSQQYEAKKKPKIKLNRHRINKLYKNRDKKHKCNYSERKIKQSLKKKAKKKVRYAPIGEETFSLKGCGYHKVYEWTWDM